MGNAATKNPVSPVPPPLTPDTRFKRRLSVSEGPQPAGILTGRRAKDADAVNANSFFGRSTTTPLFSLEYFCKSLAGSCDGETKENQDSFLVHAPIAPSSSISLFGVFDGHGRHGRAASTYVRDYFKQHTTDAVATDTDKAFKALFNGVQKALGKSQVDVFLSGATCVVCAVTPTHLIVANAGDSRCVLGSIDDKGQYHHRDLSRDHKPELTDEKKRIKKAGGVIRRLRDMNDQPVGPYRVWAQHTPAPGLAMSRSIGDELAHSVGVSCKPEIITHEINAKHDKFMIIASDGVWEFITSKEAVRVVSSAKSAEEASNALCRLATMRWNEEEEFSCDDITALVIFFRLEM